MKNTKENGLTVVKKHVLNKLSKFVKKLIGDNQNSKIREHNDLNQMNVTNQNVDRRVNSLNRRQNRVEEENESCMTELTEEEMICFRDWYKKQMVLMNENK